MPLIDGDLQAIFGAAFGALYLDATVSKTAKTDTGAGGFSVATSTFPAKAVVEALSDRARAASGLPDPAVSISLLRAGLAAGVDLDDLVIVSGATYRVIRLEADPAQAAWSLVAIPVLPP